MDGNKRVRGNVEAQRELGWGDDVLAEVVGESPNGVCWLGDLMVNPV